MRFHDVFVHLCLRNIPKKLLEFLTCFPIVAMIGSISCHPPDQQLFNCVKYIRRFDQTYLRQLKPFIVRINLQVRCQRCKTFNPSIDGCKLYCSRSVFLVSLRIQSVRATSISEDNRLFVAQICQFRNFSFNESINDHIQKKLF